MQTLTKIGPAMCPIGWTLSGVTLGRCGLSPTKTVIGAPASGWWYQGTINGITVGLTTKIAGSNYITAPAGGAVTGAIVRIGGVATHLVKSSDSNYWCCTDGRNWYRCQENQGKFDVAFASTDLFDGIVANSQYWYSGKINGRLVGLLRTPTAKGYGTVPAGEAITGAIMNVDGVATHVVKNSAGDYWCTTNGENWGKCDQHRGQVDLTFVKTDKYSGATFSAGSRLMLN